MCAHDDTKPSCRGSKEKYRNRFSPSIMWVLGIKLWSSSLATSTVSHWAISPTLHGNVKAPINRLRKVPKSAAMQVSTFADSEMTETDYTGVKVKKHGTSKMAQQVCTCACPQTGQTMLHFWDPHIRRRETTPNGVTVTTEEPWHLPGSGCAMAEERLLWDLAERRACQRCCMKCYRCPH